MEIMNAKTPNRTHRLPNKIYFFFREGGAQGGTMYIGLSVYHQVNSSHSRDVERFCSPRWWNLTTWHPLTDADLDDVRDTIREKMVRDGKETSGG